MTIPTALLPHLSLLFFLIVSAATAVAPPVPTGTAVIQANCQITDYYDLCLSSLLSRPGSSNVTSYGMGKLAFGPVFDGAKDSRRQLSKLMRGRLDPASKLVLRECGKQYDMAIYTLALSDSYMKSDAFKHFHKPGLYSAYDSVLFSVQDAEEEITKCGEMLKSQRGLVEPFKQKTEIVRQLAAIASKILFYIVV
ncbi:hypothetical protein MRB53_031329 [Persea americana]|uniref:Uncharacterized protein n=1 Tax=Persea americana TaxID=3435 RepID=A0ACC2KNT0_PERAE|nr:hypothetical protein MRB53_031329 [Persea americana]